MSVISGLKKKRSKLRDRIKAITKRIVGIRSKPPPALMSISDKGIALLRQHEGVRHAPYDDSRGFATTGVGHLIAQKSIKTLSQAEIKRWTLTDAQINDLLKSDLVSYEKPVAEAFKARGAKGEPLGQDAFDALVSFTFNIGVGGFATSTAAQRVRDGASKSSIGKAMMFWNKPPEIIGRRRDEVHLLGG